MGGWSRTVWSWFPDGAVRRDDPARISCSGEKLPNRWDNFDVEEELQRLDAEEQGGAEEKSRPRPPVGTGSPLNCPPEVEKGRSSEVMTNPTYPPPHVSSAATRI